MKIRIGVGAAGAASTPEALGELVTAIDELGFDSLWLSEVLTALCSIRSSASRGRAQATRA